MLLSKDQVAPQPFCSTCRIFPLSSHTSPIFSSSLKSTSMAMTQGKAGTNPPRGLNFFSQTLELELHKKKKKISGSPSSYSCAVVLVLSVTPKLVSSAR